MYAFLLLCIPCISLYLMLSEKKYTLRSFVPPLVFGLIVSIIVCVVWGFFIVYTHLWTASFARSFLFLLLRDTLVPTVVMFGLFFFFSKDTLEYKVSAFLPLMGTFYSIYIPYLVLSGTNSERFLPFMLFIKPLLIAALVILETEALKRTLAAFERKNRLHITLYIAMALAVLVLPPLIEALWFYNSYRLLWIPLAVLYIAAAVASVVLQKVLPVIKKKTE